MAETHRWQANPMQLEDVELEQLVLPHVSISSRGPALTLSLYKIFNYVLKILCVGREWEDVLMAKATQKRTIRALVHVQAEGEMAPTPSFYAVIAWRRIESGRPTTNIRFSIAVPTAASV